MATPTPPRVSLLDALSKRPEPGPEWIEALRGRARHRLETAGLPTPRDEAFRFTPIASLLGTSFAPAPPLPPSSTIDDPTAHDETLRIVIVNGRPKIELAKPPRGVEILGIDEAIEADWVRAHLDLQTSRTSSFAALNSAMFDEIVAIRVHKNAVIERPLTLMHVSLPRAQPIASYPRVLVLAEPGSELRIVEHFVGTEGSPHFTCSVTELAIQQDAHVEHARVLEGVSRGQHVGMALAKVARGATYNSKVVTFGGAMSRIDIDVELVGEGAECTLDGAYVARQGEVVDHHTRVVHASPHASTRERYRGVATGDGMAIFDGTVVVERGAYKSVAHQENRNLLLSREAVVHTKPHLRIDADDVKCSHGATVGSLDEDQLFYLRSRAIGESTARALLVWAFLEEVVADVRGSALQKRIVDQLLARLPEGQSIRELVTP